MQGRLPSAVLRLRHLPILSAATSPSPTTVIRITVSSPLRALPTARKMSSTTSRLAAEPASSLLATKCQPCKSGAAPLGKEEIARLLQELGPAWVVEPELGSAASSKPMTALVRTLRFRNFRTALAFANQIGTLAEEQGHHPALRVEWGVVRVEWWTHTVSGVRLSQTRSRLVACELSTDDVALLQIHKNDFIMAAKTDEVAQNAEGLKKAM